MVNSALDYLFYLDTDLITASSFRSWAGLCQQLNIASNQKVINSTDTDTSKLISQLQATRPLPLIVVGSDRTFHQLLNEVHDTFPTLVYGVMPMGWPCHLARCFGITSPSQAWQRLQQPQSTKIDLIETSIPNHPYVVTAISWGLAGQAANLLPATLSPNTWQRLVAGTKTIFRSPAYRFYTDIDLDTQVIDTHQLSLNNSWGNSSPAVVDDGLLTLHLTHSKAAHLVQSLFPAPRTINAQDPNHQIKTISIQTRAPLVLDGIYLPPQSDIVHLSVRPGHLTILR